MEWTRSLQVACRRWTQRQLPRFSRHLVQCPWRLLPCRLGKRDRLSKPFRWGPFFERTTLRFRENDRINHHPDWLCNYTARSSAAIYADTWYPCHHQHGPQVCKWRQFSRWQVCRWRWCGESAGNNPAECAAIAEWIFIWHCSTVRCVCAHVWVFICMVWYYEYIIHAAARSSSHTHTHTHTHNTHSFSHSLIHTPQSNWNEYRFELHYCVTYVAYTHPRKKSLLNLFNAL